MRRASQMFTKLKGNKPDNSGQTNSNANTAASRAPSFETQMARNVDTRPRRPRRRPSVRALTNGIANAANRLFSRNGGPAVLLPAPHDPTPDGDEDLVRQGLAPPAPVPTAIPFGNDGSSPAVTLLAPREPTPDVDEDLIRQGLAAPAPGPTVVVIDTVQEVPDEEISQEEQQEEMVKKLEDGMSGPETAEVATDLEGEVTDSESVASQSSGLARTSTTQVPMPAIMPATPSRLTQRRVGAEHPPQDTACQADEDPDDNAIRSMPGAYPREPSSFKWEDAVMILGFVVATVLLLELFAKQGVRICLDWLDQFFLSMGRLGGRWAQKLEQGFEEGFDRNGDDGKSYDAEIDIIDFYLWGNGYKA